jgi:hypothetical protein
MEMAQGQDNQNGDHDQARENVVGGGNHSGADQGCPDQGRETAQPIARKIMARPRPGVFRRFWGEVFLHLTGLAIKDFMVNVVYRKWLDRIPLVAIYSRLNLGIKSGRKLWRIYRSKSKTLVFSCAKIADKQDIILPWGAQWRS